MRTSPLGFDPDELRRAIESGDAGYLSALLAGGAEVRVMDFKQASRRITPETGLPKAPQPVPVMIDQSPGPAPHLAPHSTLPGTAIGRHVPGYYLG
jgi:hypothetical protein